MFGQKETTMTETRIWKGSCHCGAVSYEVRSALDNLMDCNCSRCRRLGWVMQPASAGDFTLLSGEDALTAYRFNSHRIEHLFCSRCGIESFARGADAKGNATVMINVNCLEDAPDIDRAGIHHWDGRSA
jgi:hypothetical protein